MAFGTCAIICAHNEEKSIENIVKKTKQYVPEVVVINDGSKDNTHDLAIRAGANVISHITNQGKGQALRTGFSYFLNSKEYDRVVTLDADGQHPPEAIPNFSEQLNLGYEVAIGKRNFSTKDVPLSRKLGNKLDAYILSDLLNEEVKDPQNGYRMFTRQALEKALKCNGDSGFTFEIEMLIKMVRDKTKISWVPIPTIYSDKIKSHIKPFKHIKDSLSLYYKVWNKEI